MERAAPLAQTDSGAAADSGARRAAVPLALLLERDVLLGSIRTARRRAHPLPRRTQQPAVAAEWR
jgi:hypothetical protein